MTAQVLDYSAGWPRDIAPYVGTVRYIGTPGRPKNITWAELDYRLSQGTPTAYVHERDAGWMLGGYDAGVAAAQAVLHDWTFNLGQPAASLPGVYAADDQDTTAGQLPTIDACLRGMASVLGPARVGVYGEHDVVEHCVGQSRTAVRGWQTRAWSRGLTSRYACLRQEIGDVTVDGVQCDANTVLMDDWGQTPKEEDDVSYDDAVRALRDVLHLPATGLAVPQGQADNGRLGQLLLGMAQQEVNRDNAEAAQLRALAAQLDPAKLAAALVAQLPAGQPAEQTAMEAAVRHVLGSLDEQAVTP